MNFLLMRFMISLINVCVLFCSLRLYKKNNSGCKLTAAGRITGAPELDSQGNIMDLVVKKIKLQLKAQSLS